MVWMHTHTHRTYHPTLVEQSLLAITSFFVWTLFIVTLSCSPLAPQDGKSALVVCPCGITRHPAPSTQGCALIEHAEAHAVHMQESGEVDSKKERAWQVRAQTAERKGRERQDERRWQMDRKILFLMTGHSVEIFSVTQDKTHVMSAPMKNLSVS